MASRLALLGALGHPPLDELVPFARTPTWAIARRGLSRVLGEQDFSLRIRSPSSLWALLQGGSLPRGCTWERLLRGHDLDSLLTAVGNRGRQQGWQLAVWNLRWLISLHTDQASRKRAIVRRWLQARRVVLLQETHWFDRDLATWDGLSWRPCLCSPGG